MKTNTKRVFAVILCFVMMAALFVGCGKKVNDKDEQGRTIVSVGNYPAEGTPSRETFDERLAKYESTNPDVAIRPLEWNFDLKSFYAQAAGGQLPTIFEANYTEVIPGASAGYLADLTDVLKKHGVYDNMNTKIRETLSPDGKVYALPQSAYALGIWVNIPMFEKAGLMEADGTPKQPKTWDEFAEFCVKIKEATGEAGFALTTTSNTGGWLFTPIAWSFGAEFVKENEDGTYTAVFNSPECVAALQFIKDLRWKYDVINHDSLVDNAKKQELFGTGRAAMFIDASTACDRLLKYDMDINDMGMIPLPAGPKKHVTLLGGWTSMMAASATEDQMDAALRWAMMNTNYKVDDTIKETLDKSYETMIEEGKLVGVKALSIWNDNSEYERYKNSLIDKYANINLNHVKPYNEFIANPPEDFEIRPEERVCAQELYGILDRCIQEVINNKDADVAAILEKANSDFQNDYLDTY